MQLDIDTLEALRRQHPAWRLLAAESAALVASFLHRVFVVPNRRVIAQADLAEALEDTLFSLREQRGANQYPKPAQEYLNDWAANDKAWLRKFYPPGSDEPHFDLTPATERALAWLTTLNERSFVGTESRLLTLFELLRQMNEGSEADPQVRTRELQRKRDEIDAEIARVLAGDMPMLGDTALKERFAQFANLARELLADFREVEHNFRGLDRRVRERITLWDGSKGALLQEILGERDSIAESDQGRSFRAFWDFLMSRQRQDELTQLLDRVLHLEPVAAMAPDPRLRRVHYDWLEAGEHAQRTVALLSQQLRRFLDDRAYLENRRIMDILRSIEGGALAVRAQPPAGDFMHIDDTAPTIELPMERPLHAPPFKLALDGGAIVAGNEDMDAAALFSQFIVDKAALAQHVRQSLQQRAQVTLPELLADRPLEQGLAELMAYLSLATEPGRAVIDDSVQDTVAWVSLGGQRKKARLPRVIFSR
jgi:flagellar motility protein MotE (MotC chaperone)